MKKGDLYIGLAALVIMALLGIGYWFYVNQMGSERYVNIYVNNQVVKSVKVTNDTDIKFTVITKDGEFVKIDDKPVDGMEYNIVRVHNNGFEVIDADCLNKDDVRQGFVKSPGIAVICVPHHLKVVIEGDSEFDAFT